MNFLPVPSNKCIRQNTIEKTFWNFGTASFILFIRAMTEHQTFHVQQGNQSLLTYFIASASSSGCKNWCSQMRPLFYFLYIKKRQMAAGPGRPTGPQIIGSVYKGGCSSLHGPRRTLRTPYLKYISYSACFRMVTVTVWGSQNSLVWKNSHM